MSRWLYNVGAVQHWALESRADPHASTVAWWTEEVARNKEEELADSLRVGEFIGQGRNLRYCGLVSAFIRIIRREGWLEAPVWWDGIEYEFAMSVARDLAEYRPRSWYASAVMSLVVIWVEIIMAIVVDVFTPTIGLGCWSGSITLYAILSTGSWALQFIKRPNKLVLAVSHYFNFVSILWLLLLIVFFVSLSLVMCGH